MKKKSEPAICGIDYGFKRIGGKYKGRILWALHSQTILRYGELRRTLPDISPKMLTQTLRELEADELVERIVYPEVPPKVEYKLKTMGQELIPFIQRLGEWGLDKMQKEKINSMACE